MYILRAFMALELKAKAKHAWRPCGKAGKMEGGRGVCTSGGHVLGTLSQQLQGRVYLAGHLLHQPRTVCHCLQLLMHPPA